jgi:anti-sigma factor RsiW
MTEHAPFDTWMYEEEELTDEQARLLEEHLQGCAECAALRAAWQGVESFLQDADEAAPGRGFRQRWQMRLEQARHTARRRQAAWLLAAMLGAGSLLGAFLGIQVWFMLTNPADLAIRLMQGLGRLLGELRFFQELVPVLGQIFQRAPAIPWLLVSMALSLVAIWGLLLYRAVFRTSPNGVKR